MIFRYIYNNNQASVPKFLGRLEFSTDQSRSATCIRPLFVDKRVCVLLLALNAVFSWGFFFSYLILCLGASVCMYFL